MRFDDRLKTVMTQPVADAHDRTVRWRQLVDLLSRPHDTIDPALFDAALTMIRSGIRTVARPIRAATARSIAGRASDPRLLAIFAADRLEVAAPVLAAASLDEAGWEVVLALASEEVEAFIRTVRGVPKPVAAAEKPLDLDVPAPPVSEIISEPEIEPGLAPSIGEMVARIERLKSKRVAGEEPQELSAPPPSWSEPAAATGPMLFRWECDASGEIAWVDGAPRGALIGRSLPGDEGADRSLVRAFADRMPFDEAAITIPALTMEGEWKLSGIPAFSPSDGRFLGYRGIGRRGGEEVVEAFVNGEATPGDGNADTLRETIHEIKTPLNAIIGFAEIIDGQYLGPAHRNYRERAAEIVSQARILLAAIEDLDFAARMKGATSVGAVTPVEPVVGSLLGEMESRAAARQVELRLLGSGAGLSFALERDLAERLLRRFIGAVVDAAEAGEQLRLSFGEERGKLLLSITRPAATQGLSARQMLDPAFQTSSEAAESKLGLGFGLRLVRGLVRLAGGDLRLNATELTLVVPATRR